MADIRLAIAVDSSGAIQSIKTFNAEVDKTPASANKAGAGLGDLEKRFQSFAAKTLSIGAAIAVAWKSFDFAASAAKSLGVYSDQIVTLHQRTGLAVSSLQAFNHMAKLGGTSVEALSKSAVKMEVAIAGGGEAFKKMGLSVSALRAMSPDQAFSKVATAIGSIESPMEKAAAAVAVFGKSGAEMLPMFTESMEEARRQAESFGLVLSDKTMLAAEALGDAMDTTGRAFDAFLMRMVGVVAESPAVLAFFNGLSQFFGDLAPLIEKNKDVLLGFVKDAVDAAVQSFGVLADSIMGALNLLQMFRVGAQGGKMAAKGWFGADLTGDQAEFARLTAQWDRLEQITVKVGQNVDKFKTSMSSAAKINFGDMGGLGVWAPGGMGGLGVLAPRTAGGGGGGSFLANPPKEIKIQELKVTLPTSMARDLFSPAAGWNSSGELTPGQKTYNLWGDQSKFLPPELEGNIHVAHEGAQAIKKSSTTAAQALENFANLAALSTSKLGKSLAAVFGSGAGLSSGVNSFKTATDFLGKLGAIGSIATAGIGIIGGIVSLFKKKPKEPPPEPPKSASAKAWADFTGDQQSKGAAGILAGVSGILPTSPEAMADQAGIALSAYWAMWKDKGPMAAAAAFAPIRDKMLETFKAGGASQVDIDAMLGGLSTQVDLAQNKAFGGAAEGMNGYAQALASIANQQMPMTLEQFKAFERQALAGYEQMKQAAIDQGLSAEDAMKNALLSSGQFLTTLKDAASKYGFDLGGSQALIDNAAAAGISFGSSSEERLIMSLDALTTAIGGAPPKFQQAISAGAADVRSGGSVRGGATGDGSGLQRDAEATGEATAGALEPGLMNLGQMISEGFASAVKNLPIPTIVLDTGGIVGAIAGAIEAGDSRIPTASEGRG